MLLSALAFLAGTCLLLLAAKIPNPVWLIAVATATLPIFRFGLLRYAAWIVLGYCWAAWQADSLLNKNLPVELAGRDVQVQGVVNSLPEQLHGGRTRFYFAVTAYRSPQGWQPIQIPARLTWYRGALAMQAGEKWQLRVRLKEPHGLSNPGGFDFERWLFSRGVRATGYVKKSPINRRSADSAGHSPDRLRQRIAEYLNSLDLPAESIALLRALTVGDRAGMTRPQWQVLQATGTTHLLAISGLHVGLVATLVFAFSRRAWAWSGAVRYWPAPRFAALAAMLAALGYALLAGFQVPARRALIMVWVWMLAILMDGRARPWQVLGAALWLILLLDPLAALGAGFWLSFGAVALIFFLTGDRHGRNGRIRRLLTLQAGLVSGLMPLTWLWFQQSSLMALPANLLAIPWVGILVVPLLLLAVVLLPGVTPVSQVLFHMAAWLLDTLWLWLDWLAGFPGALWSSPVVNPVWLWWCAFGVLVFMLPRAFRTAPLAIILLMPAFLGAPERPGKGDLWINLLDVGQGLSVVLVTSRHVIVYDAGPGFPSGYDTGSAVVAPFLMTRGFRKIDRLIVSHGDNDHRGGVVSLLQQLPAASIHSGDPAALESIGAEQCHAGQHWTWDQVNFAYLAPLQPETGNNGSCVLRVSASDGRSILLTGDIEKPVERILLNTQGIKLSADVLVAPHHGSLSSSTPAFLERVRPELVLFAVGYHNRFGFPSRKVRERYKSIGAELMNTADHGAISIRFDTGKPLKTGSWRAQTRRLWHSAAP
jgi:competence protein ComEC